MSNINFELLNGLEARYVDPEKLQFPGDSIVLYALENNEIVGRIAIVQLPHIEGTWIREDKRGSSLAVRLITKLENIVEEEKRSAVFAFAHDDQPEVGDMLERFGYELLPIKVYMKPLVDSNNKEN